jgi:hypothetical protein
MNKEKTKNERFERLQEIILSYRSEVERCRKAKAFLAGTVMLGAEVEGLLLAMMELYSAEVQQNLLVRKISKKYEKKGKKSYYDWSFFDLLKIAKDMGWLPSSLSPSDGFSEEKAEIGDYIEIVRTARNLVHPGLWAREYPEIEIKKEDIENYLYILEVARTWLRNKVVESIREEIDRREKRETSL